MQLFTTKAELQSALEETKKLGGGTVVFVPTMGALHEGHLSLIKLGMKAALKSVVSIFVNPMQFNNPDDLANYPRNIERDRKLLEANNVDYLFAPEVDEVYPGGESAAIKTPPIAAALEGRFRPGHFEGVVAVVHRLFEIVRPDFAVFGEKDFQQLRVVEEITAEHFPAIRILRGPTVREPDGLALSSRNTRLSPDGRAAATALSRGLFAAQAHFKTGMQSSAELKEVVRSEIAKEAGIELEYLAIADEESLEETWIAESGTRILLAAYVGGVRLIDNVALP